MRGSDIATVVENLDYCFLPGDIEAQIYSLALKRLVLVQDSPGFVTRKRAITPNALSTTNRYHRRVLEHSLNLPPKSGGNIMRVRRFPAEPAPFWGGDLTNVPRLSCDSGSRVIAVRG